MRLLGFFTGTVQIRTDGTAAIGLRCMKQWNINLPKSVGCFSRMAQMRMHEMPRTKLHYMWHPKRDILTAYGCCSSTVPISMHGTTGARHHSRQHHYEHQDECF